MQLKRLTRNGIMLAISVVFAQGCTPSNEYQPPPPPSVTVAKPIVQEVTIFLEENGQTEPVDRAEVRARLQGFLEEIKFVPGSEVLEGDVLYMIERRQYQATLDSAKASLLGAQAGFRAAQSETEVATASLTAANAELNVKELTFQRLDRLLPSGAIAQREWDDAQAARDLAIASRVATIAKQSVIAADLEKARAQIIKSEADVNQAQINLDYTEVKAPISGRITKTDLTRGNLVQNGTLLASIVGYHSIWANFNINERDLLRMERIERKKEKFDITKVKAFLQRSGDHGFPYEGHLDYADPEVNQDTGTLAVRAIFTNSPDKPQIIPGLFVRVRLPIGTLKDAILIPEVAVGRDQVGTYVLTVGPDNIIKRNNVVMGNKHGNMIVVSEGLTPTDSIVIAGLQRARPGSEVTPKQTTLKISPPADQ